MKKISHCLVLVLLAFTSYAQQDWDQIVVPADAGTGNKWELQTELSDSFNYQGKGVNFRKNWVDRYVNGWGGPGLSNFSSNHSDVLDGNLVIRASRNAPNRVFCGVISSKKEVLFPIYMEVNMKGSATPLSSNFWFISEDQVNEIDVNEVYGRLAGEKSKGMGTNYHIFRRSPFKDLANSPGHHLTENGTAFSEEFHRVGVYWKDAFNFDFYLDGKLVRQMKINDPRSPSVGFNQPMQMIIDIEDHPWRSNDGIVANDAELADDTKNRMYVDWIRMYKPVDENAPTTPPTIEDAISLPSIPESIERSATFTIDVEYETDSNDREIVVSLWKDGKWLNATTSAVASGKGSTEVTITLPETAVPGDDYFYKYHIRPRGTTFAEATADGETNLFSVVDNALSTSEFKNGSTVNFTNPVVNGILTLNNIPVNTTIQIYSIVGQKVLEVKSDTRNETISLDISDFSKGSYLVKVGLMNGKQLLVF